MSYINKYRIIQQGEKFYIEYQYEVKGDWFRYTYMDFESMKLAYETVDYFKKLQGKPAPAKIVWSE